MSEHYTPLQASLPLLLWRTPPGLELILAQEGVPFERIEAAHRRAFRGGRFVLFDGCTTPRSSLSNLLAANQVAIDIDAMRRGESSDPFAALVDHRAARAAWRI